MKPREGKRAPEEAVELRPLGELEGLSLVEPGRANRVLLRPIGT